MDEWGHERDLELDLLAAHCGRARQARNKVESARELLYSFDQRRTRQRPLSGFAPQAAAFSIRPASVQ